MPRSAHTSAGDSSIGPFPRPVFWLQVGMILAACWFVYAPVMHGEWVWDDRADIAGNPLLRTADGLKKIWFQPALLFDFYPLKYSFQWLQWQLWHEHTTGYHATNVALHLASALLFWRVLGQLGLRHGWLGGLLFAVHPVAVQSVAWIAELKNTLSLPPLLLSISAFLHFERDGRPRDLVAAAAWFLVKMLCKTSAAMLPAILLLYLWWRRGRIGWREIMITLPFFAISLVLGLVTVWFQLHRGIGTEVIELGGGAARVALAGTVLLYYLKLCLWPFPLLPIYPQWTVDPPAPALFLAWVALGVTAVWIWRHRAGWGRPALFGLGWFFLYLLPVSGWITVSYMRFTWVMDHHAYVSLLGLIGLAVAGLEQILRRLTTRSGRLALAGAVLGCTGLGTLARAHAARFQTEHGLWHYTLQHNPAAWMAHNNLGAYLDTQGQRAAARRHYETAIQLHPRYADAHKNLADHLGESGDAAGAAHHYQEALRLRPDFLDALVGYGEFLRTRGEAAQAVPLLRRALEVDAGSAEAYHHLGLSLRDLGYNTDAVSCMEFAVRLQPTYVEAHSNLGSLLRSLDRTTEAIAHLETALRLLPTSFPVRYNLANALQAVGRHDAAVAHYTQVLQLQPGFGAARYNLGLSLLSLGRTAEARQQIDEARRLDSNLPDIKF